MKPTGGIVVKLPKLMPEDYNADNDTARPLAEKTRRLRLYALKTAPDAFASSYEEEVQRDLTHTLERLKTPHANHFFACDREIEPWTEASNDKFFAELLQADFVGSVVLIGPLAGAEVTASSDPLLAGEGNQEEARVKEPLRYVLNGTFVDPVARGSGLGKALIEAALATGQQEAANRGVGFLCTVLVDSDNVAAKRLYENSGFVASGEESYVQQPRMRMDESKAEERFAVQMEIRR